MKKQQEKVVEFYNSIAKNYKSRYDKNNPFFQYFFIGRMIEATRNENFEGKSILDIGAGPGNLYDFIKKETKEFEYFGTDITEGMLEHSSIPAERRFVGHCYDLKLPLKEYDYIFLLGVTTYMPPDELQKTISFVERHLSLKGKAIITFTNRGSIDYFTRFVLGFFIRPLGLKNSVLGQNMAIYSYTKKQIVKILSPKFKIERISHLNQTVFPFNRAFKNFSIIVAKVARKHFSEFFIGPLSSDILIVFKK
ncbi:MAG: methyltransferase domain-containing protein [Pseudomonadota bacterium]|nr:methyltransferase domain-containing protein [Pseudomonadota bacterium]